VINRMLRLAKGVLKDSDRIPQLMARVVEIAFPGGCDAKPLESPLALLAEPRRERGGLFVAPPLGGQLRSAKFKQMHHLKAHLKANTVDLKVSAQSWYKR